MTTAPASWGRAEEFYGVRSCITRPGRARPTYRNFFAPAAHWPFTGLRLARSA